jgi:cysteine desulfurase/selenocysteine lyase
MDSIPSFAAHEPSSEQLSRIAAQFMSEAAASSHATMPAPLPAAPAVDALPFATSAGALPVTPAATPSHHVALPTQPFTPSIQPFATPTAAPLRTASAPVASAQVEDFGGLKSFVARIRGSDAFATQSPRFDAPAPSGVAGFGFFDVDAVRRDFPILHQKVHGKPLAWFDNAATTQKPQHVIDSISRFYANDNSNIHRGAHTLAARSTDAYEHARRTVQTFLGASSPDEIIFVRGTTEGINLVAQACGSLLSAGDEIVLTELEHHANIVPWQMVAKRTGAVIRVAPINDRGEVMLDAYAALLGPRTKFVSLSHASNSLGTILPVELMTGMAKARGARVLVDGAQTVSHFPVDVRRIGCDFFVFSGHKIFGPTGIGAVYATAEAQNAMQPWQGGGNMIRDVTFEKTIYADPPAKFEAGTPNIADAIGLGAALDYVTRLGRERIAAYEHDLLEYATHRLTAINGLRLIGTAAEKVGVLSFVLPGRDVIEIGKALDREGFAVRAGHHCAQPSLRHFGLEATVRPSLAFYNTRDEIDRLAHAVARIART